VHCWSSALQLKTKDSELDPCELPSKRLKNPLRQQRVNQNVAALEMEEMVYLELQVPLVETDEMGKEERRE
jgi:hypothetical protein